MTVNIALKDFKVLEYFCDEGIAVSKSELIRIAVREFIEKHLPLLKDKNDYLTDKPALDPTKFVKIPGYNNNKPVQIIKRLEY